MSAGDCVVVVIATVDVIPPYGHGLRVTEGANTSRERYVAESIGQALDKHAAAATPGAKFEVEYIGRANDARVA